MSDAHEVKVTRERDAATLCMVMRAHPRLKIARFFAVIGSLALLSLAIVYIPRPGEDWWPTAPLGALALAAFTITVTLFAAIHVGHRAMKAISTRSITILIPTMDAEEYYALIGTINLLTVHCRRAIHYGHGQRALALHRDIIEGLRDGTDTCAATRELERLSYN